MRLSIKGRYICVSTDLSNGKYPIIATHFKEITDYICSAGSKADLGILYDQVYALELREERLHLFFNDIRAHLIGHKTSRELSIDLLQAVTTFSEFTRLKEIQNEA